MYFSSTAPHPQRFAIPDAPAWRVLRFLVAGAVPFFYIITCYEYGLDADVTSFSLEDFEASRPVTTDLGRRLLQPETLADLKREAWSGTLAAGSEHSLELPGGSAAVRELRVLRRGYSTETRIRALDGIVFTRQMQHDMEILHTRACNMDYAVGMYWYAREGLKHNRPPDPVAATAPLSLPDMLRYNP